MAGGMLRPAALHAWAEQGGRRRVGGWAAKLPKRRNGDPFEWGR